MKYIRHIFTAGLLAAAIAAFAQSPRKLDYGINFPGDGHLMAADPGGLVYVAGTFSGNETFGAFDLSSNGGNDVFVIGVDATGEIVGATSFGGPNDDAVNSIDVDGEAQVYLSGNFSGLVDFDPGSGEWVVNSFDGSTDGYVLRLNAELGFEFVVTVGGVSFDEVTAVTVFDDNNDNIYFTGAFDTDADINYPSGTIGVHGDGISSFFAKVEHHGNRIWEKTLTNDNTVYGTAVTTDVNGAPVFAGYYQGTVNLNPDAAGADVTANAFRDLFILKLNPGNGTFMWGKSIGGDGDDDYTRSIATDGQSNVYLTGQFSGSGDFDPGSGQTILNSNGATDIFIAKFNSSGNLSWAKSFGDSDDDIGSDIYATGSDVYTIGHFHNDVIFGGQEVNAGSGYSAFILDLDNSGNMKWVAAIGSYDGDDYGYEIAGAGPNLFILGQVYSQNNDMDPTCDNLQLDTETAQTYLLNIGASVADCLIITQQPVGEDVCAGQKVVLTVVATGTGITYQWMMDNGDGGLQDVEDAAGYYSGSNTATLTVTTGNDYQGANAYVVVLTRGAEELYSDEAFINVGPTTPYTNDIINCGSGSVQITAVNGVNGQYRWYTTETGGSAIAGVTSGLYTTPVLSTTTSYWVSINDGNCESQRVKVTVNISTCQPAPGLKWARAVGATSTDFGGDVIILKDGNLLVPGAFSGTIDFGLGATTTFTAAGQDGYLLKLTPEGEVIWVKVFTGASSVSPGIVKEDAQGNLYMTGTIQGLNTTDFDGGAGTFNLNGSGATYTDVFVMKFDKDGNPVWGTRMGNNTYQDSANALEVDASGVYITGYFYYTFNIVGAPNTLTTAGGSDIFLLKMSPAGTVTWLKQIGNSYASGNQLTDSPQLLHLNGNDLYIGVAIVNGTIDVDPGTGVHNLSSVDRDASLVKLNTDGEFQSAFKYESLDGGSSMTDIQFDAAGNMHVSGIFYETNDFDPGSGTVTLTGTGGLIGNNPSPNGFVAKYKPDGTLTWVRQLAAGSLGSVYGSSMSVAANGDIVLSGGFQNSFDADPGSLEYMLEGSDLLFNSFVIKLNDNGDFNWAMDLAQYDNTAPRNALGGIHVVDAAGDVYMTGTMAGRIDFDPSDCQTLVQAAGATDYYIWKLSLDSQNICFSTDPEDMELCAGDVISLYGEAVGAPGITYQWQKQNGQAFENINDDSNYSGTKSSELKIDTKSGFGDGNYRVIASAPKATDKTSSVGQIAIVGVKPAPPTTISAASCLTSADLQLKAVGGSPGNYRWYDQYGSLFYYEQGETYQTGTIDETQKYYVAIIDGSCESNKTLVVASIDVGNNEPIVTGAERCTEGSLTLSAAGAADGQYHWFASATSDPITGQNNSAYTTPSLSETSSYYVSILLNNCESPRAEVVATISRPEKPVSPDRGTCTNTSVELTATAPGGEIRWYTVASGGSPVYVGSKYPTPALQTATSFFVSNFVGECESDRTEVKVSVSDCTNNNPPTIMAARASAAVGGILVFDLTPYLDDPDDNLDLGTLKVINQPASEAEATIDGTNLVVDYTDNDFHGVEVVTIEVCDIAASCAQQDISIEVSTNIVVYNAVSPNDDGKNDVFFIGFIDSFEDTKSNRVTIYNRWGDLVFDIDDYNNIDRVFKGTNKNGNELASGTYYYKIDFNSTRKTETGYLSLKR
jgi:gliding motility-associated-like protein